MKKTTNWFIIFLGLKLKKIWPIVAGATGIIGLVFLAAFMMTSTNVWVVFIPIYIGLSLFGLLYGTMIVFVLVAFCSWIMDNIDKAKDIAESRKAQS